MGLAFKIYGHIEWPPHPAYEPESVVPGTIEIHYVRKKPDEECQALLRWVPKDLESGPISNSPNVYWHCHVVW